MGRQDNHGNNEQERYPTFKYHILSHRNNKKEDAAKALFSLGRIFFHYL